MTYTTNLVIRKLARRIQGLNTEMASIEALLSERRGDRSVAARPVWGRTRYRCQLVGHRR